MSQKTLFSIQGLEYKGLCFKDFTLAENTLTCIAGKSGAGKSTLLKLLNKTLSPQRGTIFYKGRPIQELDPITYRREVLLCGQNTYLENISIRENFRLFYEYREEKPLSDADILQYLTIAAFGLPLDTQAQLLSGGEAKRVHLAITLSFRPKVLLLDEITSPLDDETAKKVFKNITIFSQKTQTSVLFVTHNPAIQHNFAQHTHILENSHDK